MFICQYCGKEVGNKGCLTLHEKYCLTNPNRIISKTQAYKEDKDSRRDENGKIQSFRHGNAGKHLSEEHKQKIRESYHKWMSKNHDTFIKYSSGQSKACEIFKQKLRNNGIDFIEEYMPYWQERAFRLDIAFPDEKIGVEINGTQHYDSDGTLNDYTLEKQKFFEDRGWKIIQIYYKDAVRENPHCLNEILNLPICNKQYIKEDFDTLTSLKRKRELKQEFIIKERILKKEEKENSEKQIIQNLIENSGIDFSKSTWSTQATEYLKSRNELWNKLIFRCIRKYFPDFLKRNDVWKRKGSKY